MSAKVQRNAVIVDVTDEELPARIEQHWFSVTRENRNEELLRALRAWGGELNLVFCNTRIDCADVARFLQSKKIAAVALHGDLDQSQRSQVLVRFANRSASVLIATDVAARGLDVDDVDAVFNYELPAQPEVYIHRIGRTARAGKEGEAVSLVESREMRRLMDIEALLPEGTLKEGRSPASKRTIESLSSAMTTLQISGGRKNKLRPGDLGELLDDLQQLHFEHERRAARDARRSTVVAVGDVRGANELRLAADLHLGHALGPAGDHAVQGKRRRLTALDRAVEDVAGAERAVIVNLHGVGAGR